MTKVIYFDGVHGVGKTTVKNEIAKRLQNAGMKIYSFPEMSYYPDIDIRTYEFQIWFINEIMIRDLAIDYLVSRGLLDFILVDRHKSSIDIYTEYLNRTKDKKSYVFGGRDLNISVYSQKIELKNHEYLIHLNRSAEEILENIIERLNNEVQRSEWEEDNEEYFRDIHKIFRELPYLFHVYKVNNVDFDKACNQILSIIYTIR
jgi:thymidylate kinase